MRTATRLLVPDPDERPWPTLGPEICDFITDRLVHGPGDLLGEDVELTDEERLLIYRAYEVYPRDHARAGRRRFKRVGYSRRKGVGKTELAQFVAICEMDPEAPVRVDGWRKRGREWVPVGRPVHDPMIPMVATTREQVEGLAYGGVKAILEHERCDLVNDYDCTLDRIQHVRTPGKMVALASAPDARDGARTSWQHFDETHRFDDPRLVGTHATMLANIPKRPEADAWSLETTTTFVPGAESVAEDTHLFALAVHEGQVPEAALLYDHRQADARHAEDLDDEEQLRKGIIEASGDALPYTDAEAIVDLTRNPRADRSEIRRLWLNVPWRRERSWIDLEVWDQRRHPEGAGWPPRRAPVVLFFEGSYNRDSTALIGCTVAARPHVFVVEVWERPPGPLGDGWRTPHLEVDARVDQALARWDVVELAPDPPGWHREVEEWEQIYGEVVVRFPTKSPTLMGPACELLYNACAGDPVRASSADESAPLEFTQDGNETLRRHLGNAVAVERRGYTVITKDSPDSPRMVDAAVGAVGALARAHWHWVHGTRRTERRRGPMVR